MQDLKTIVARRRLVQWCLLPIAIVTIAFGWKYPVLGFTVPILMIAGIVGSLFRGRYVCGHLCPRGAFLERMIGPITLKEGGNETRTHNAVAVHAGQA